jgi:hypothetical protein
MPQSVTKHKANGEKTSMEHQKLWIRWRRIIQLTSILREAIALRFGFGLQGIMVHQALIDRSGVHS